MARKTIGEIKDRAQAHLGDDQGDTFNRQTLHYALENAFEDLVNAFMEHQVLAVELVLSYELPAATTELNFEAQSVLNVGSILLLEERASGTNEQYTPVMPVEVLPQWTPGPKLVVYQPRNERLYFVGATQNVQLRISYYATGALPVIYDDSAAVVFENVSTYLSWRTAAIAGPAKGYNAQRCDVQAQAALLTVLKQRVRDLQDLPRQAAAYRVRPGAAGVILPWLVIEDGVFDDTFSDEFA